MKRIEEIRKDIENNQTQPIEFLSEIMLIQTEIINFIDTDIYKQKTVKLQKSEMEKELASIGVQTISEEDKAALLQNQNTQTKQNVEQSQNNENETGKWMQIYATEKKHFWKIILEKILNLFGREQEAY